MNEPAVARDEHRDEHPDEPWSDHGDHHWTGRWTERWDDLGGARVHWVDFGGPGDLAGGQRASDTGQGAVPLVVCVHGLGGATVNWEGFAPLLTGRCRVVALDLVGFGLTEVGTRTGSVEDNTELLGLFLDLLHDDQPRDGQLRDDVVSHEAPVILMGNSMGGLIAARCALERPGQVAGVALIAPALPRVGARGLPVRLAGMSLYGSPAVGRTLARGRRRLRTPEQLVGDTLRLCTGDLGRVADDLVSRHVALARLRVGREDLDVPFAEAGQSLMGLLHYRRQIWEAYAAVTVPVLLAHGTKDRLVPYRSALKAAELNRHWWLRTDPGVGHVIQMEDPTWLADEFWPWLAHVQAQEQTRVVG